MHKALPLATKSADDRTTPHTARSRPSPFRMRHIAPPALLSRSSYRMNAGRYERLCVIDNPLIVGNVGLSETGDYSSILSQFSFSPPPAGSDRPYRFRNITTPSRPEINNSPNALFTPRKFIRVERRRVRSPGKTSRPHGAHACMWNETREDFKGDLAKFS